MKILKNNDSIEIINKTFEVLKSGGLVVFPSDTVYGLLCDATNEKAVEKLIRFKNRPPGKAISVFCDFHLINRLVKMTKGQEKVVKEILPGAFTIILPSKHKVSKLLESEKKTLGIRIPKYQLINQLIQKYKKPVTATSANVAGRPSHYSIKTLLNELSEKQKKMIDLIVDQGILPRNKPSTVVDMSQPDVKILRQGDISFGSSKIFISKTPEETKKIARSVILSEAKNLAKRKSNKPLIFIIEGEVGVGKTVFVKGIGESLGIKNIVSPTFVIYYEYGIKKSKIKYQISKMIHIDLFNIQDKREFMHLGLESYLKSKNILCFEWGEKAGEIIDLLESKGKIIHARMKYINERERKIIIDF